MLGFGLNGWNYSYKISYRNIEGKVKSFRLFPRTGGFDMEDIITETRKRNKNVDVTRVSFGIDELFQK
jgi:hypothetical protein